MNKQTVFFLKFLAFTLCALLPLCIGSCENPEGALKPNSPPETRLANVPPNDTIAQYLLQGAIPEQTLYWAGDDPDGYVIAFQYTWTDVYDTISAPTDTTTLLNLATVGGVPLDTLIAVPASTRRNPGALFRIYNFLATLDPNDLETQGKISDSLSTLRNFAMPYPSGFVAGDSVIGADPLHNEAPTKGIFIFDSPTDSNMHRFEVWAIDNQESIGPTPARIHFWTLPSPGLTVYFTSGPTVSTNAFILRYPTERSPGLLFTFSGIDPSTDQRDYSWTVDDTVTWSEWSPEPTATVTAIDFQETGGDTHIFYLRGRNKWGVISPDTSRMFTASIPPIDDPNWPKKILILNNCRITTPASPVWMPPVDSAVVNAFYVEVMDSLGKQLGVDFDIWTTASHNYAFPTRDMLAQYTSILFLSEQELPNAAIGALNRITTAKQTLLTEYLTIGGKLIFSGSPNIRLTFGFPLTSSTWEPLADDVFHIVTSVSFPTSLPFVQNDSFDFTGAKGSLGYPDVSLDSTKLPPEAIVDGVATLRNIALNYPRGFGQTISEFDSKVDSTLFEDAPLGVRYLAPPPIPPARETYSVVYFGFPLYYANKSDVIATLRKALEDINE